jgi:putative PIN family toxin of toxin-antitoxin system
MKVVLDTNTIISGLFWNGAPRQVLDMAHDGLIDLYTSIDLLAELADVLSREKFSKQLDESQVAVDDLVTGYSSLATVIHVKKIPSVIRDDPDDDMVLACAISADAQIIVSGDSHLLR